MIDENGFTHLTRKKGFELPGTNTPKTTKSKKEKHSTSKDTKVQFKKGSWKHRFLKRLSTWASSRYSIKFHFVKLDNYVVYNDKGRTICVPVRERIKKSLIKKLRGDHEAFIMINTYDQIFTKLSVKAYMKLMRIGKIMIGRHLTGSYDGVEQYNIYEDTVVIDNINDLMRYINHHRQLIDGICDVEAYCCGYSTHGYDLKIMVQYTDGEVKTYRSDMNDFMKDHGLYQF